MRINPQENPVLLGYLQKADRLDLRRGVEIPDTEYVKLIHEHRRSHPFENVLQGQAWAVMSYAGRAPRLKHRVKLHWDKRAAVIIWRVLVTLAVLFLAIKAHAQGNSQIDNIQIQDSAGTLIKTFAAPFKIKCDTNLTCTVSGSTVTLQPTGGGGSGTVTSFSAGTLSPLFTTSVATATTTPALTFILSNAASHTFFGNCTGGLTTPAFCAVDYAYLTGTPQLAQTNAGATHNFLTAYDAMTGLFTKAQPSCGDLSDAGSGCSGTAGGVTSVFTRTGAVTAQSGDYGLGLIGNPAAGTSFSYALNQSSVWTLQGAGRFKVLGTPLQLGDTGTNTGQMDIFGTTSGSASISVADAAGTPNKILLPTATAVGSGYLLSSDGGNPQQTSWVAPPAGSGTVTSVTFTGDGTVLSSTPSSAVTTIGTLTAALATAAADKILGNFSGSTAAPTYGALANGALKYSTSTHLFTQAACADLSVPCITAAVTSVATTAPITGGTFTTTGTIACATCAIGPGASTINHLAKFSGTDGVTLADGGAIPTGTVSSVATTSPITGGTITATGTIACATCAIGPGTSSANHLAVFSGTDGVTLADAGVVNTTGTVTSVAVSAPLAGGTITSTGTLSITGAAGQLLAGSTPAFTATPSLGTDNSVAGTLQLANGSANAHTIWGSGATTSNTILGFATAPTTGHLVTATVSGTTTTLTDGGAVPAGTVTSVATSSPITGGTFTGSGTVACATCVTSAAALTSNAVVIGGGLQASSAISADTTTTHALFATAGAPAFRAIATGDIPSAIPIGNIGSAGLSGTSPVTISAAGAIGCGTCLTAAVTSVATTGPITGGTITGTGTIACATCATTTNGGALSGTSPVTVSVAGAIACATCITTASGQILNAPTIGISGTSASSHILSVGSAPTCTFSTGGGTSPSCAVATGSTDQAGRMVLTTGGGTPGSAGTVTLTLNASYGTNSPVCVASLTKGAVDWSVSSTVRYTTISKTAPVFTWNSQSATALVALTASTAGYDIDYICIGI